MLSAVSTVSLYSPAGRALLKKQRQKRDKKRPKRHTTPNQKRKKIALAKKASCTPVEHVPGPETPLQQCPSADPSLMVPDVSGSEVAVLPANSDIV